MNLRTLLTSEFPLDHKPESKKAEGWQEVNVWGHEGVPSGPGARQVLAVSTAIAVCLDSN